MHDQTIDSLQQCVAVYSFSETGLYLVLNGSTTWKWGWTNQRYSLVWGGREGGTVLWVTLRGLNFKRVPPTLGVTNSKGCHLHWVRQISKGCHLHWVRQISKGCHLHWVRQIQKGATYTGCDKFQKGTTYTVGQTERVKFQKGTAYTVGQTEQVKFKRAPPTLWVRQRGSNSKGYHLHWVRLRGSNSKGHHIHCGSDWEGQIQKGTTYTGWDSGQIEKGTTSNLPQTSGTKSDMKCKCSANSFQTWKYIWFCFQTLDNGSRAVNLS